MKLKALLFVAAMAVTSSAMAANTITLGAAGTNKYTGGFSSTALATTYTLDLTSFVGPVDVTFAGITSNYSSNSGYDITGVTQNIELSGFDYVHNTSHLARPQGGSDDFEFFAAGLAPGKYTVTVAGDYLGPNSDPTQYSGYTGSVSVSGVLSAAPEPAAWSLRA